MLEFILIGILGFLVLTFFYKQAVCEFRLNQIEWTQKDKLSELFSERVPIIIRGRPPSAFWTQEDVLLRDVYGKVKIFEDRILSDWLITAEPHVECPWKKEHARLLGSKTISGLGLWAEKTIDPIVQTNPFLKLWIKSVSECWAGEKGLFKTIAPWTAIFVTQGTIVVNIMTESVESSLPPIWSNIFPSRLTHYDTPFISDLKYMDIVLRPGNILFMPAHWFVSWTHAEENEPICPMICSVEYHTPVSRFAEACNKRA
jgi:hypothetical protein